MYTIEIRSYHGDVIAQGAGRSDWQTTLTRLARKAGIGVGDGVAVDNYFPTDAGRPWGTHHVQFGRYNAKAGGTVLSNTYIVSVQQN